MTTAIDTNVLVALWDAEDTLHRAARAALDKAFNEGTLVISGAVYAELLAAPGRTEAFVDRFCEETGIGVEWELGERVWRVAGGGLSWFGRPAGGQNSAGATRRLFHFFILAPHTVLVVNILHI